MEGNPLSVDRADVVGRPRARDLGLWFGDTPTGRWNAITDVEAVCVGHTTLIRGEGPLRSGKGPVRTGVTVILPHSGNLYQDKVVAAVHTINGHGKVAGFEQTRELGTIETPIALTNTLNVGLVADALVEYTIRNNPDVWTLNPFVGETNDSVLNDIRGRHVRLEHVLAAIGAATSGPVAEGAVGAGTGTVCFGWKGGIGTASRKLGVDSGGFTVGALVQSNFGASRHLMMRGIPVGRFVVPQSRSDVRGLDQGSIMMVIATDAPLTARQLRRLCVRAAAGLAHTGSSFGHSSGDFCVAFSTTSRMQASPAGLLEQRLMVANEGNVMNGLLPAAAECVEEAILNSLCRAVTVVGRDDNTAHALPVDAVAEMARESERLWERLRARRDTAG